MERELTDAEIERQDVIDDAIYDLIYGLAPDNARQHIDWDISIIGEIRDCLTCYYESLLMENNLEFDENEWYPYIEIDDDELDYGSIVEEDEE